MEFETVIGLEVHCELSTKSKIFCSCTTEFGGEPNTHTCEVCTGMPGTLPVLNKNVVEYAIRTGIALNCEITRYNRFDRKNYFYPDLPKAYQVSQLYLPICQNGHIDIKINEVEKSIRIKEIHMEEDAGKLIHHPLEDCTLVDFNRCGVPLLEIVSEPDFYNENEVIAYLTKLKAILQCINVSDCKMQEGSLRVDINLSVKPLGQVELGTRTEMKNMNSFKAIERSIIGERKRQIELIEEGKKVIQATRRWEDNSGTSIEMRSKENSQDYRYFPEPDLFPVEIDDAWIERVKNELPEFPEIKKSRYIAEYVLPEYDVDIITGSKALVRMFEDAYSVCQNAKEVSNWIMGEVLRLSAEVNKEPEELDLDAKKLGKLIVLVKNRVINRNTAKIVFERIFYENVEPEQYVKDNALQMVNDDASVKGAVIGVIEGNPKSISEFISGNEKVVKFLIGQAMKQLKGKSDPTLINKLLIEELKKLK